MVVAEHSAEARAALIRLKPCVRERGLSVELTAFHIGETNAPSAQTLLWCHSNFWTLRRPGSCLSQNFCWL
jgi:hypothetical protein